MRILLTHHFPFDDSDAGAFARGLARSLLAAGHQVRCVIVDSRDLGTDLPVRRIICDPHRADAELSFSLPCFSPGGNSQPTFERLTDEQLVAYRDVLRQALDAEIHAFDPHIVHGQHIWIQGHLALEAGVPYVLTAWGPELAASRRDERYGRLAQEAAENASRILAPTDRVKSEVSRTFGELDPGAVTVLRHDAQPAAQTAETFVSIYRDVLAARFGADTRP
jgi:hypothetical protein